MANGHDIWHKLLESNKAYATKYTLPSSASISHETRNSLVTTQTPQTCILSCSDSRVPPELIFGAGLNELFVIRTAGTTTTDPAVLGSVEYAVEQLGCKLVVIMGHMNCGAVKAAVDVRDDERVGMSLSENLRRLLVDDVGLVVEKAVGSYEVKDVGGKLVKDCMKVRVEELMERSDVVRRAKDEDKVVVVPAFYDFKTGLVSECK